MMKSGDKAQIIWAVTFVISGIVLGLAVWMIPVIGVFATTSFIIVYIGISAAFAFIFREIESVKEDTLEKLKDRHAEIIEIQKAIAGKYYSRKIDQSAFRSITQDYERKLTELEVKIRKLEKGK